MRVFLRTSVIVLFLSGVFTLGINAQLVTIETLLDTNHIEIGNTANLKYIITKKQGDFIELPSFTDTLSDGIEIVKPVQIDSTVISSEGKVKIEQQLTITSYEPGMRYIPSQGFLFRNVSVTDTIYSNSSYLYVVLVETDSSLLIRDIKPVEWVPPTFADLLPFIIILVAVGLLVFLLVYFFRKKKKNSITEPAVIPSEPPHIIALRELDKLKAQKIWQQNHIKEYYSILTGIVRTYIEHQFGIMALEKTTGEIIRDVNKSILAGKVNISQLERLLNLADLVKFAREQAQPDENIGHLDSAYDFIKESHKVYIENTVQAINQAVDDGLRQSFSLSGRIQNAKNQSDYEIFQKLEKGYKLVQYSYCISIIVLTFKLNSKLYLLNPADNGKKKGIIFSSITILLGWWGIPWGPVRSFQSLVTNFNGGKHIDLR